MRTLTALVFALAAFAQQPAHDHAATAGPQSSGKVLMLPRNLELRLAVDALPPHLRSTAGIRILGPNGYTTAREATNPFTCIVSRRGGNLYPVCFDEEGTRTILPAFIDDATLRLKGETAEAVERKIADGFAEGRYRPPSRPGIAYMLSPATYLMENGKLTRSIAHTMFYAPFLTDADIGGLMGRSAFVDRPGPHGMIIVPAGQTERENAMKQSAGLIEEVERAAGLR